MCGIFGIVFAQDNPVGPILIEAGKALSYRGYDSVGCATINEQGEIDLRKDVGKVEEVAKKYKFSEMMGSRAILQLRWATFGPPSKANAQPHLDSQAKMVGAHNGNVVNHNELRQEFISDGMIVRSTNDGETCVHAVERHIARGHDSLDAIRLAYNDLAGDYAFVLGRVGEDCLYALKKGSGLVVGIGDGFTCLSSDLPSILSLTRKVIRVQDGEIVHLWAEGVTLYSASDGQPLEREPEWATESMDAAKKDGYPHFMLKEIHEQPQVARELLHRLDHSSSVDTILEKIQQARNLYLVGCGTSYHACLLGSIYLAQLAGRTAIPALAPQFTAQYGPALSNADVAIFVSQSGETKDVLNAIDASQPSGLEVLGLANVVGSTLTQVSSYHLPLTCGYEISVPATKTFTNQAISFLYLAQKLAGKPIENLHHLPVMMEAAIDASEPQVNRLTTEIADAIRAAGDDLYCLGYGPTYPIALEGALKLKEITYAHCEGMLSTEFKHGPLSAVEEGYPVIFVAPKEHVPLVISGINEVTCRGGRAIAIGEADPRLEANAHDLIVMPPAPAPISALLSVLPLQLLSYRLSLSRGYNPDFPRNLSKTLTVD